MDNIIEKLITAADNHSEDTGEDHGIGDLQDLLRQAWSIMSVSQKRQLIRTGEVGDLVEAGARGEFEVTDLESEINQELAEMEVKVVAAGGSFMEHEGGFYWETEGEAGEDFHDRGDAVVDAYNVLCCTLATQR